MDKSIQILIGQKFGRLIVKSLPFKNEGRTYYTCLCKCGNEVSVRSEHLKRGITKSCGCLQKDVARNLMSENMKRHGLSNHPLNRVLNSMKQRCYNKNDKGYKYYGGRGVSICNEWVNDFQSFYSWAINHGYKEGLSIDRVDVNGNYSPENCRFVSMKEQSVNKKNNVFIEYKGKIKTLSEWCAELNLKYNTIYMRLNRGWDVERTFASKRRTLSE